MSKKYTKVMPIWQESDLSEPLKLIRERKPNNEESFI